MDTDVSSAFFPHHQGALARPRSGARGFAVRFLGETQGPAQAQSRRRSQKRSQGTDAEPLYRCLSVCIGG